MRKPVLLRYENEKTDLIPYANHKGAAQPLHPRNLISAFVVRYLGSITYYIQIFQTLASLCGWAGRFES